MNVYKSIKFGVCKCCLSGRFFKIPLIFFCWKPLLTTAYHQIDSNSIKMLLKSEQMEVLAERFQVEVTRKNV